MATIAGWDATVSPCGIETQQDDDDGDVMSAVPAKFEDDTAVTEEGEQGGGAFLAVAVIAVLLGSLIGAANVGRLRKRWLRRSYVAVSPPEVVSVTEAQRC